MGRAKFETAHAAAMSRGEEDRRALAVLGAEQVGLGLVDELYRPFVGHEELLPQLAASIAALLDERRPRACAFPVGLGTGTSDHELARDAAVHALRPRVVSSDRVRRTSVRFQFPRDSTSDCSTFRRVCAGLLGPPFGPV